MSVNYNLTVRNDRLTVVLNAIDAGVGSGILSIGTASMTTVLAQFVLNDPCGVVAGGVLTFSGLPVVTTATGGGIPIEARITDSVGTIVVSGLTVATANADLIISQASVSNGDNVALISASITGN